MHNHQILKYNFIVACIILFTSTLTTVFENSSPMPNKIKQSSPQLLVKKDYLKEIAPLQKNYKIGDSGYDILKMKE